ncbi:MAG: asparagine synthase (glutamine-hydrolyzing) [Woeseiaceae bacterium]
MCGIAGIVSPVHRQKIVPMTRALIHRGPDGEGFYTDDVIAIGQRRLSIIDLAGGKQPIANEAGNLQLVCNGEIYNSPTLRQELIAAGHTFRTATDVEVILHLYEEYGVDCIKRLRGMFAFAIWDRDRQSLFLGRDHMGQKPLFYVTNGSEIAFASEVKALLASGLVEPQIDLDALWHYMSLRFIPDQYSLFRNIRKLPAATFLTWADGKTALAKYWSPDYGRKHSGGEAAIEEGLNELLLDTVRMHMLSDVRVGAFLSGGIDSSLVTAMMTHATDDRIPTFSIGVKEQDFNELPYARMVSDRYGLEAHEQTVQADLVHLIPTMIHHLDEPSDPFGVGVYLVAKIASEHVKVVLSGDGGDENFAGYDRFAGQRLSGYYSVLPSWFRDKVMRAVIRRIPESFGYKSIAQKAAWLNEMSFYSHGQRYAQSMSFLRFTQDEKQKLFTEQAKSALTDSDSVQKILAYFDADNAEDLVDRMLYTDLMTRIPDHLLPIVDRMSMAHSLETRPPLIDYKVVEYAAAIPANLKLKGTNLKYLLKQVAARYLPRELIYRKKQGFGFPLGPWMRTDLRHFIYNLFAESRFVEHGLFDGTYIDRIVAEHMDGKVDHNYRLWVLINLEIWYRLYFEGTSVANLRSDIERLMQQ